jgi:hypothetical protein
VQGFTPAPMTLAIVIYYSGYHPYAVKLKRTPKTKEEREDQHNFFFWYKRENKEWIKNILNKVGRHNLLQKLFPEYNAWEKNKTAHQLGQHTFHDAIPFNKRKKKVYRVPKNIGCSLDILRTFHSVGIGHN